ncbi:hypothetical protein N781_07455 [Pontibacillus halophilus JSM 076056 = DSM 19796]|uniref:Zinc finger DksA/TraR C4-type domain-containing protein n=1 Tax=Pontibacillus halophilus JSM 076056 = DSM 19796 TaxID=1385510 RepID=A0A0A5GBZ9_9BACI|nr:TraR/DksA C4-type zinc finger protein [Pontibacillus halophilus]KGX89519.1 hypothetical protein N781_07455 [Pontibacillus halophilus JSM 076056 = DSM 19796]
MLTEQQQQQLKDQLESLRTEALKELDNHNGYSEDTGVHETTVGELADYDNHPGDTGTEEFEQDKNAALTNHAQDRLDEIDAALDRLSNGTYGVSEKSGEPIPFERLEAMPTARLTIEEEQEEKQS